VIRHREVVVVGEHLGVADDNIHIVAQVVAKNPVHHLSSLLEVVLIGHVTSGQNQPVNGRQGRVLPNRDLEHLPALGRGLQPAVLD
jgi:hypothetical protein